MRSILGKISKVAQKLDEKGQFRAATRLDQIFKKLAEEFDPEREEEYLQNLPSEELLQKEEAEKLVAPYTTPTQPMEQYVAPFLALHGLQLLSKGDGAVLGAGAYGTVFKALRDGQEVAVKFLDWNDGGIQEGQVWQTILEIKKQLSSETQKHLPQIHDIIYNEDENIVLIVMEVLQPLDPHLMDMLFGVKPSGRETRKSRRVPLKQLLQPEVLYNLLAYATDQFQGLNDLAQQNLTEKVFKYQPISTDIDDISDEYGRIVLEEMAKHVELSKASKAANNLIHYFTMAYTAGYFPSWGEPREVDRWLEEIPEAASLYKALHELRNFGVDWGDVHYENIMQKKDGTPVIIDVGMYKA